MYQPLSYRVPITDDRGRELVSNTPEPAPGSVVLVNGEFGCAWQRQFEDGLWRSVRHRGNTGRSWEYLLKHRNVVLVYEAAVRQDAVVDEDDKCPGHALHANPHKIVPCSLPYGHGKVPEGQR